MRVGYIKPVKILQVADVSKTQGNRIIAAGKPAPIVAIEPEKISATTFLTGTVIKEGAEEEEDEEKPYDN